MVSKIKITPKINKDGILDSIIEEVKKMKSQRVSIKIGAVDKKVE